MPDLVALQSKYGADGLAVIGADVSWSDDNSQTVADFLATFTPTINYQVIMSDNSTDTAFGGTGGISGVPTTFIIDRQNLIRKKYVGTQSGTTLERQIIPLLYRDTRLGCERSGNQMTFCWRTNAQNFTLQYATNLGAPMWMPWPNAPTIVNGTNRLSVPTTSGPRFFRLNMKY
jgi:hypothetical protein